MQPVNHIFNNQKKWPNLQLNLVLIHYILKKEKQKIEKKYEIKLFDVKKMIAKFALFVVLACEVQCRDSIDYT